MREKLLPFNLEAEYLPGDQMRIDDYDSRATISTEDHQDFRTSHSEIGGKIKSRCVRSLDIKDLSRVGVRS